MKGRVMRTAKKVLLSSALAALLIAAAPAAAYADTDHELANHYSSDNHAVLATGFSEIDWYSSTEYEFYLDLKDVSTDGKGPILDVEDENFMQGIKNHYYHNESGSGVEDLQIYDSQSSQGEISSLHIKVCNGGSQSAELNCKSFDEFNPYGSEADAASAPYVHHFALGATLLPKVPVLVGRDESE
jgi:hypothetical protein